MCGCRRRGGQDVGPLPQAAVDLGLDMIECQMLARCQQGEASFPLLDPCLPCHPAFQLERPPGA